MSQLPRRPPNRIVRAEALEAWSDGFEFLKVAERIRDNAEHEAAQAEERARDRGYEDGLADGRRETLAEFNRLTEQAEHYFDTLSEPLADLALDIVRRLLGTFNDRELITQFVGATINEFRAESRIVIRVAPENHGELDTWVRSLDATSAGRISHVEADRSLDPRQCLLISPVAVIDVGIDAQLERLRTALSGSDVPAGANDHVL